MFTQGPKRNTSSFNCDREACQADQLFLSEADVAAIPVNVGVNALLGLGFRV